MGTMPDACRQLLQRYRTEAARTSGDAKFLELYAELEAQALHAGCAGVELFFKGMAAWKKQRLDEAREAFDQVCALLPDEPYGWHGLGNVYRDLKRYDDAEKAFRTASELDKKSAHPWHGLGNVYRDLKRHDDAEKAYRAAIELDKKLAHPWHGLGNVYRDLKRYDDAEKAFRTAIELDKTFAYPWNGLGNVYRDLKRHDDAEKAYRKAIECDDDTLTPGATFNLDLLYNETEHWEKALQNINAALAKDSVKNDRFYRDLFTTKRKEYEELQASVAALKTTSKKDPIYWILAQTRKGNNSIEAAIKEKEQTFFSFLDEKPEGTTSGDPQLVVLRRWNSYTPIIADNYHISKGGGYFIQMNGQGLVIDPGFNFIDNFKGNKHSFHEIDAVLISHAHNDHTTDLESILTLLHEYNERIIGDPEYLRENTILFDLKKKKPSKKKFQTHEIEAAFKDSPRKKVLEIYMPLSVQKKYSGMFSLMKDQYYHLHILEPGHSKDICGGTVRALPAKHSDIISDQHALGFLIRAGNWAVVYTGDTGWGDQSVQTAYLELGKELEGVENKILIAHLGGFKGHEVLYSTEQNHKKVYYQNHLGRLGVAKVAEAIAPHICLISEFGEEFKEHRTDIAQIFTEAFRKAKSTSPCPLFFPADIGLRIRLNTQKVRAITGIRPKPQRDHERELTYDDIPPRRVGYRMLRKDYSLHYFDTKAGLDECDMVEVLRGEYEDSIK